MNSRPEATRPPERAGTAEPCLSVARPDLRLYCLAVIPITWGRPISVCALVDGKQQYPLQCASPKTAPFLQLNLAVGAVLKITCGQFLYYMTAHCKCRSIITISSVLYLSMNCVSVMAATCF